MAQQSTVPTVRSPGEQSLQFPPYRRRRLTASMQGALLAALGLVSAQPWLAEDAAATPQGGVTVAGQGAISQPDAATTLIHQQSHSLALEWSSFDIGASERVIFNQPSASASALNRILSHSPSSIQGALQANGRVFLINPNGIVFGGGARVNVGSLFASSLDISVADFMAGRHEFASPEGVEAGLVVNRGIIQAAAGGSVSLVGGTVANEGLIVADVGQVNMAAGNKVLVDFDGDGLIRFEVDGEVVKNSLGAESAVSNTGEIRAAGGQVLMEARVTKDVFTRAVNNEGIVKAGRIEKTGGRVMLTGLGGGVRNTGSIDASGDTGGEVRIASDVAAEQMGTVSANAGSGQGGTITVDSAGTTLVGSAARTRADSTAGAGGSVRLLGERVGIEAGAQVSASGATGGGELLVGGGVQGADASVRNALATYVGQGASLNADASGDGDGGTVVVWADGITRMYGDASARGAGSGGGGFIETSGKRFLDFNGSVDAGVGGTWLLDPEDIEITNAQANISQAGAGDPGPVTFAPTADDTVTTIDVANINTALDNGSNVAVNTASGGAGAGNITISAAIQKNLDGGNTDGSVLTLNANGTIVSNASITASTGTLDVFLNAGGGIDVNAAVTTNGGSFTGNGTAFDNTGGIITTAGGAVDLNMTAGVTLGAAVNAGTGNFTSDGTTFTSSGTGTVSAGSIAINHSDTVIVGASLSSADFGNGTSGDITVVGSNGVTVNAAVASGNVSFAGNVQTGNVSVTSGSGAIDIGGAGSVASGIADGIDAAAANTARSGNVTVSGNDGISGAGTVASGNATVDAATAGEIDTARSGNVTLTATAGNIALSNATAVTVGSATVSTDSSDITQVGDLVLSAVAINNGAAATALGVTIGGASGATGIIELGALNATTTGGAGDAGAIRVTSTADLRAEGLATGGGAQNVSVAVTGGGNLTKISGGTDALTGDEVTFDSGSGLLTVSDSALDVGAGNLTLIGDDVALTGGANSILGAGGNITIQPFTIGRNIDVGTGAAGNLALDQTDIAALSNGFNLVTIGRSDGTGILQVVGEARFRDSLLLQVPGGGAVAIDGALDTTASGDAGNITLDAGTRVNVGANITTINSDITFQDDVSLEGNPTISTGAGGGNVTVNGTVNADSTLNDRALTVAAGTGNVTITGDLGLTVSVEGGVNLSGADISTALIRTDAADTGDAGGDVTITSTGNVAVSANITADGDTSGAGGTIVIDATGAGVGSGNINVQGVAATGAGAAPGGNVSLLSTNGSVDINAASNLDGGTLTTTGTAFDNTGGAIQNADDVSITHTGAVTVGASIDTRAVNSATEAVSGNIGIQGASVDVGSTVSTSDVNAGTIATRTTARSGNISLTATTGNVTVGAAVRTGNATAGDAASDMTATSGSISVSGTTGVGGAGNLTTGLASVDAATASTDVAIAGNVNVTATGGNIALSNATAAITTGTASVTNDTGDTARAGNITLSGDAINNGTASTPLVLTRGAASGATTLSQGRLAVTTDGLGAAGEAFVRSGSSLLVGQISTDVGSAQTVSIQVTGGGNLTKASTADNIAGDSLTFDSGTGLVTINDSSLDVGSGNLTITADDVAFAGGANSIAGSGGSLVIQPSSLGRNIDIGVGAAGNLALDQTQIEALANGFNQITIGRADGNGDILVTAGGASFRDALTLLSSAGGDVFVQGVLNTTANNDAGALRLDGGNTTFLSADLTTADAGIDIDDNVVLLGDITLGTGTGAGNVAIDGTVNADDASVNDRGLIIAAGTGNITLSSAAGTGVNGQLESGVTLSGGTISTQAITTSANAADAGDAAGAVDINATGNVTVAGAITASGNGAGAGGEVTIDATGGGSGNISVDAITLGGAADVRLASVGGGVDVNGSVVTNGGSFTGNGTAFDNTGGTLTTSGGLVDLNMTAGVTLGAAVNTGIGAFTSDGTGFDNTAGAVTAGSIDVSHTGAVNLGQLTTVNLGDGTSGGIDVQGASVVVNSAVASSDVAAFVGDVQTGNVSLTATGTTVTLNAAVSSGDASGADAAGANTVRSGNVSVTAATGVGGAAGTLASGTASVNAAQGDDAATSGDVTVNVTGAGDIGLGASPALIVGTASVTNDAAGDAATAGDLTLTADAINNATPGSALNVSIGEATDANGLATLTQGRLVATTDGAGPAAGELLVSTGGNLITGLLSSGGNLSLQADTLTVDADATAENDITLTANTGNVTVTDDNPGADQVTRVESTTGNITATVSATGVIDIEDTATGPDGQLRARGNPNQTVVLEGNINLQANNPAVPPIDAEVIQSNVDGTLHLGDDAGVAANFRSDANLLLLLAGANSGLSFVTDGDIVIDMATPFVDGATSRNLSLTTTGAGTTIDDAGIDLAFQSAGGMLTLQTASGTIGATGTGLAVDAAAVEVTGTGGNAVQIAATRSAAANYAVTVGGAGANVSISQAGSQLVVGNATTGINAGNGDVTLATTAGGSIADSANGAITADLLTASAQNGIVLDAGHAVNSFAATNTASGNVTLNDAGTLDVAAGGISNLGRNVSLTTTGALTDTGAITAGLLTTNSGTGTQTLDNFDGTTSLNATSANATLNFMHTGNLGFAAFSGGANITLANTSGNVTLTGAVNAGAANVFISTAASGSILGAGPITANNLTLSSVGGIGTAGTPVNTNVAGTFALSTTGAGAAGSISILESGALATSEFTALDTADSAQTARIAATGTLTHDNAALTSAAATATPFLDSGDSLELVGATGVSWQQDILGGAAVTFTGPTTAVGNLTSSVAGTTTVNGSFNAAGSTQFNSSVSITGPVVSGGTLNVTGNATFGGTIAAGNSLTVGGAGSFGGTVTTASTVTVNGASTVGANLTGNSTAATFNLNGPVEINGDVAIKTDNLNFGGAVSGQSTDTLTISPVSAGKTVNIGAASGETLLAKDNVSNLQRFGGDLNLGGRASSAKPTDQNFGNVTIVTPLGIGFGGAGVLTPTNGGATPTGNGTLFIASLGDVVIDNANDGRIVAPNVAILAAGDGTNPTLGSVKDTNASATLSLAASNKLALRVTNDLTLISNVQAGEDGTGGGLLGVSAPNLDNRQSTDFEGVENALFAFNSNTTTIGDAIVALAQGGAPIFVLTNINSLFNVSAGFSAVQTGLDTTGLGELGFIDEGLFLLPSLVTQLEIATKQPWYARVGDSLPSLPNDPGDDDEWEEFYAAFRAALEEEGVTDAAIEEQLAQIEAYRIGLKNAFALPAEGLLPGQEGGAPDLPELPDLPDLPDLPGLPALPPTLGPSAHLGPVGEPWSEGGLGVQRAWWSSPAGSWPQALG